MRIFLRALVAIGALGLTASSPADAQNDQVYRAGSGVTLPVATKTVAPQYTSEAMREKIKGSVVVEVTVTAQGEVTDVEITRSLDAVYGLDEEAVKAAKQWKFKPGKKDGKPVAVRVWIEMAFTLK